MTEIRVNNLTKKQQDVTVLSNLSLTIETGSIVALVGPNGCGKSTLLNILAGIETKDTGSIEKKHNDPFAFSYVFQGYQQTLLPWRTNLKNLMFPLEIQKQTTSEIKKRTTHIQELIDIPINWNDYPYQLSGGQRQILSLMRALVTEPKLLFLDEPFSALDYDWTLRLRLLLQRFHQQHKSTIVLITHSIEEAVQLADTIVVLSNKPTQVHKIINNPLAYPRETKDLSSERFIEIQKHILTAFQQVTT